MGWLKNTFVWIMVAVIAVGLSFAVVTRPKPHVAPPAVVKVETPKTYTEFREAHEPPERVPPAAKPEPAKVAVEAKPRTRHSESRVKQVKAQAKRATVKPESGANPVSISCDTARGYVEKFGRARVVSGAQNYGYTERDAEKALTACGL